MPRGEPICPRCGRMMVNGSEHLNCRPRPSEEEFETLREWAEQAGRERDEAAAAAIVAKEALGDVYDRVCAALALSPSQAARRLETRESALREAAERVVGVADHSVPVDLIANLSAAIEQLRAALALTPVQTARRTRALEQLAEAVGEWRRCIDAHGKERTVASGYAELRAREAVCEAHTALAEPDGDADRREED